MLTLFMNELNLYWNRSLELFQTAYHAIIRELLYNHVLVT